MTKIEGLGSGLYTPVQAARLVGLRPDRIRRWLQGYEYSTARSTKRAPALIERELGSDHLMLSFLDLVEVLFVNAFLKHGVSPQTIRRAADAARAEFHTDHPFCVHRFETDGRTVFARIRDESHDERLVDLSRRQVVFKQVFQPLLKQLEYDPVTDAAIRWWPMGKTQPVVLDPDIAFGEPVVGTRAIPTRILAAPIEHGKTDVAVADWYEVPVREVRAAVSFERSLLAAA